MSCCICIDDLYKKKDKKKIKSSNKIVISKSTKCLELKCGHKFHKKCLLDWFYSAKLNSNKCPMCRNNIIFKDYSLNELRYNIRFKKIQETLVSRAKKRIKIQNNISSSNYYHNYRDNTIRDNTIRDNTIIDNNTNSRYYINFNIDYVGFIENTHITSQIISDNTLHVITQLYNGAEITPYVNDQNILMDLLHQFRLYNLRLYELRNYILNGREYINMPILVDENRLNYNILNEYQSISLPETYTVYNSSLNDIINPLYGNSNNIQRNTALRYLEENNPNNLRTNLNNDINYDELNEDQKLIDEMGICLECRINNENYLKFVNNYIKKEDKQKMQIIKRTKKDKIYKNKFKNKKKMKNFKT